MRPDGGVVSDFELMQVTAEYEAAVAAVPELRWAFALQENALSVRGGRMPGPGERGLFGAGKGARTDDCGCRRRTEVEPVEVQEASDIRPKMMSARRSRICRFRC